MKKKKKKKKKKDSSIIKCLAACQSFYKAMAKNPKIRGKVEQLFLFGSA